MDTRRAYVPEMESLGRAPHLPRRSRRQRRNRGAAMRRTRIALLSILLAGAAHAASPKLAKDLPSKGDGAVPVIVQFRSIPGARQHQNVARRGGRLTRELGVVR